MRMLIRESECSTPEAPLYFWRVWDGNICRRRGTADSEQAATVEAEKALRRLDPYAFLEAEATPSEEDEMFAWLLGQGALK